MWQAAGVQTDSSQGGEIFMQLGIFFSLLQGFPNWISQVYEKQIIPIFILFFIKNENNQNKKQKKIVYLHVMWPLTNLENCEHANFGELLK